MTTWKELAVENASELYKEALALQPVMVGWRRTLHRRPECGLQVPNTSAFVQERLVELGIPFAEAVLTIGKFQAGDAANVIPEQAGKSACCQETFSASSAVAPGDRGIPDAVPAANGPFGHHTSRVRFSEDYLPQAATIYAASALNWLANHSR